MDDQTEVVAFLSQGASYGKADQAVDRIETHISIVFLVGDRAYKLKRAVFFSYLDFSTAVMRGKACKAELELNRRTAAALYLRVHAITRDAGGRLAFDGEGAVIDWVVEMQRFSQSDLFDSLAESGDLTPQLIRDLADVLVQFHSRAEPIFERGSRAGMEKTIVENNMNLIQSCPPLDLLKVRQLCDVSTTRLSVLAELLDKRRAAGKVRRCHGDLHLRNVCVFNGRPTPFDCIEFNDAVSCIDVLYDLAFLLMDLVHKDLGSHANALFNRYFDMTDELDGLQALPLFMSVRAAIRAHVAVSTATCKQPGSKANEPQSYFSLAEVLLQQARPCLIAIGGLSGVGKSTMAQALAPYFQPAPGARTIRSDVVRKRLFDIEPERKLPPNAYEDKITERVYGVMCNQAVTSVAAGYTAIVDATFLKQEERIRIANAADVSRVPFVGLWLEAPNDMLNERIGARRGDASDADTLVLQQQLKVDLGTIDWHRIDAAPGLSAPSLLSTIKKLMEGHVAAQLVTAT